MEHRGELAVRGGIVDVFPSTEDAPVRIDLFGDEVDRLTTFDVADQRSTGDLASVELFGCRELLADDVMRARAADLVGEAPWGRHQWERLAEGELFDGMESWLPWLAPTEELVTDLLGDDALVVLVEPRRVRDRAARASRRGDRARRRARVDLGSRGRRRRATPAPALRPVARPLRSGGALHGALRGGTRRPLGRVARMGADPRRRLQAGVADLGPRGVRVLGRSLLPEPGRCRADVRDPRRRRGRRAGVRRGCRGGGPHHPRRAASSSLRSTAVSCSPDVGSR